MSQALFKSLRKYFLLHNNSYKKNVNLFHILIMRHSQRIKNSQIRCTFRIPSQKAHNANKCDNLPHFNKRNVNKGKG